MVMPPCRSATTAVQPVFIGDGVDLRNEPTNDEMEHVKKMLRTILTTAALGLGLSIAAANAAPLPSATIATEGILVEVQHGDRHHARKRHHRRAGHHERRRHHGDRRHGKRQHN